MVWENKVFILTRRKTETGKPFTVSVHSIVLPFHSYSCSWSTPESRQCCENWSFGPVWWDSDDMLVTFWRRLAMLGRWDRCVKGEEKCSNKSFYCIPCSNLNFMKGYHLPGDKHKICEEMNTNSVSVYLLFNLSWIVILPWGYTPNLGR